MKLRRSLYAQPEIIRGQHCTSGAAWADPERMMPSVRAQLASNLPATRPHITTASTVSLHCNLGAEQRLHEGMRGCVLRCEQLARQWHARGQGFKSPQLHQAQRIFDSALSVVCRRSPEKLIVAARTLSALSGSGGARGPAQRPQNRRAAACGVLGRQGTVMPPEFTPSDSTEAPELAL
jgi:hypothetical protein